MPDLGYPFIRLFNADETVQDFVSTGPKMSNRLLASPRPKFQEGDLVRYIGTNRTHSIPYGGIGVVRYCGRYNAGVEWAGWTEGHDLSPLGCTRHSPRSGWFVPPESIGYAT